MHFVTTFWALCVFCGLVSVDSGNSYLWTLEFHFDRVCYSSCCNVRQAVTCNGLLCSRLYLSLNTAVDWWGLWYLLLWLLLNFFSVCLAESLNPNLICPLWPITVPGGRNFDASEYTNSLWLKLYYVQMLIFMKKRKKWLVYFWPRMFAYSLEVVNILDFVWKYFTPEFRTLLCLCIIGNNVMIK